MLLYLRSSSVPQRQSEEIRCWNGWGIYWRRRSKGKSHGEVFGPNGREIVRNGDGHGRGNGLGKIFSSWSCFHGHFVHGALGSILQCWNFSLPLRIIDRISFSLLSCSKLGRFSSSNGVSVSIQKTVPVKKKRCRRIQNLVFIFVRIEPFGLFGFG